MVLAGLVQGSSGVDSPAGDADLSSAAGDYGEPALLANLQDTSIDESSGLVASRTRDGLLWTINDSGPPRLFAVDHSGQTVQQVTVREVEQQEWEDVAGFRRQGTDYFVLADTGDNLRQRPFVRLHVIVEPSAEQAEADVERTIRFRYPQGPYDCEAIAYDPESDRILLITKLAVSDVLQRLRGDISGERVRVFAVPFAEPAGQEGPLVAEEIAQLPPSLVTAMDISADGSRAVVLTYLGAWLYDRKPAETWAKAFSRSPRVLALPPLKQPEAICFGAKSADLYLTSEQLPTPLWHMPYVRGHLPGP